MLRDLCTLARPRSCAVCHASASHGRLRAVCVQVGHGDPCGKFKAARGEPLAGVTLEKAIHAKGVFLPRLPVRLLAFLVFIVL